jgi:hypothetical protein
MVDDSVIDYEAIDEEIRGLCRALNSIPGLQTTSSCYGHGRIRFQIHMKVKSIQDLNLFLWAGCGRFFNINRGGAWALLLDGGDPDRTDPYVRVHLTTTDHGHCLVVLQSEIDQLVGGLSAYSLALQKGFEHFTFL